MKKKQSKTWSSWFDSERATEDFMNEREQHVLPLENLEKPEGTLFQIDQDVRSNRGRAEETNEITTVTTKSTTISSNTSF